ncbi:2Fe-2S iron-sulfur cluster-binding protein [Vibrio sp. D431a]|uniref:2Fe-2S iron-sulfur cluster-binding protein n=1 Tax=Vibrio sp. D431a TaxID=2837388 RepID=UPI00255743BF|nr:2Fe-2S iron-sulfur cluster-binding protein [Vibrio sp. D431a]MDK9790118.1 2Fe-2S iron-sulfur cluster binding domain-containing protein [Vibrio sp. D431a]
MKSRVNGKSVKLNSNDRILDQLEKQGVTPNYQCRNGMCGFCRCKLVSGSIEHIDEALVSLQEKEILPCIAVARTAVVIEFDYDV